VIEYSQHIFFSFSSRDECSNNKSFGQLDVKKLCHVAEMSRGNFVFIWHVAGNREELESFQSFFCMMRGLLRALKYKQRCLKNEWPLLFDE